MAFALARFKAYGTRTSGSVRPHARQVVELHITAANTDTAYDIDNAAGTFWTAALANSTYGSLATQALNVFLTQLPGIVRRCITLAAEPLIAPYVRVASGATGQQYTTAMGTTTAHYPSLAFVSGSAPTAITLVIEWTLIDGVEPVASDLGPQIVNP